MINTDQISIFAKKNTVPVKQGRKCVDGRYTPNSVDSGMIARPGADAGYLEVLIALKNQGKITLSVEEIFTKLRQTLNDLREDFYLHTDHHANTDVNSFSIGCGHLAKAANPELCSGYEVQAEDLQNAIKLLKTAAENEEVKITNLPGEHKEAGVLINIGKNHTLESQDDEQMFFLYDKTRDDQFIEKLVEKLAITGLNVDDFKSVSDTQLNATLKNLALGLPIYQLNADSPESEAILVGEVK